MVSHLSLSLSPRLCSRGIQTREPPIPSRNTGQSGCFHRQVRCVPKPYEGKKMPETSPHTHGFCIAQVALQHRIITHKKQLACNAALGLQARPQCTPSTTNLPDSVTTARWNQPVPPLIIQGPTDSQASKEQASLSWSHKSPGQSPVAAARIIDFAIFMLRLRLCD